MHNLSCSVRQRRTKANYFQNPDFKAIWCAIHLSQMAPSFVVVEFLGEHSVAVVPTKWTEDDGKNTFCYWPRPNPTHSRIRKAEIPDKQFWERLPIRVFRKTLTDEEEIRPKKKCRKEKTQIFVQAPPLPELPTFNFPISSEYQTTSASTSQYQTTPRHPGRPHSPARSSTSRLSPDRNASSSSQYQTAQASTRPLQPVRVSTRPLQEAAGMPLTVNFSS
ncbi:uncharacterized protein LOC133656142 isoform X5 [Entelurus aequoreus]|uniref:uncharacterized protein LOC133656142 isoform X5 n=1 Tax=Entelurus aequoreus TaxID=161455 RepID=UPI002B1E0DB0|nr:uncharacterized protein LOC133656142 isoform X5 [Entelurus aequoreus]